MTAAISTFETVTSLIITNINSSINVTALYSIGEKLFVGLSIIVLVWRGFEIVMQSGKITDVMGSLIRTLMLISIAYWMMGSNDEISPVAGFITDLTGSVAHELNRTWDVNSATMIKNGVTSIFGTMADIGRLMADLIGTGGWTSMLTNAFANIPVFLYLALALAILMLSMVMYIATCILAIFASKIAIVLAPILVPWIILEATSFIFDGWLKFFITTNLYKVVGATVLLITEGAFTTVTNATKNFASLPWTDRVLTSILIAVVAAVLTYLMMQVPAIASGLISGGGRLDVSKMLSSAKQGSERAAGTGMQLGGKGMQLGGGLVNRTAGLGKGLADGSAKAKAAQAVAQGIRSARQNVAAGHMAFNSMGAGGALRAAAGMVGSSAASAAFKGTVRASEKLRAAGAGLEAAGVEQSKRAGR